MAQDIFIKIKYAFILFLLTFCYSAHAQTIIQGIVTDSRTHRPVPFASLGIKGKDIGTVADEDGAFRFSLGATQIGADKSVVISSVGYEASSVSVATFGQGKQAISLTPLSTTLKGVTIKPIKFKTKVFGRTGSSTIMTANMFTEKDLINDNLGKEQATVLSIDKHCYLRDFNLLMVFNRFQSVKFRLSFYSVKNGQPDRLIVDKDILFDVTQRSGWQKVDLTPYDIYLDNYKEIAVAIQWVKSVKADSVSRSAFGVSVSPVPFHNIYFRNKSQADWKKVSPAYVAFNLTADSFNPGTEKQTGSNEEKVQQELPAVTSDSIRAYLDYTRLAQQAAASVYGSNNKAGKYLHLADADLYYEVYGSGQPLLLLHGNSASIASFYQQIPELAKHYRVIALDTRGQGKSTDDSKAPLSYDKFALDTKQLLDSLHIEKVSILGWSDGGNTGLIMAAKFPSYMNKLVTMGAVTAPEGVDPALMNQFKASLKKAAQAEENESGISRRLLTLLINEPHITIAELESIKAPVLVIAGEKDVVKPKQTKLIADHIAPSKLVIIKGATHYAPQEKPEQFNQLVLEFLK